MRSPLRLLLLLPLLAGSGPATARAADEVAVSPAAPRADLVLVSGHVVTLQDPEPKPAPTAVAVAAGRIVLVGDDEAARAAAAPGARVIDLEGAVVVPGFCDAHCHVEGLGKALEQVDLVGTGSAAECADLAAAAAAALPPDAWVQGRGWDQNDWPEPAFPDRARLDGAVGDRPALLRRIDGHAAWASSEALRRAGIDAATPDPDGGRILRDAAGEPTGILVDRAIELVDAVVPEPTAADRRRRLGLAFAHCLERGVTSVHDAGVSLPGLRIYEDLADRGELPLRVHAMLEDDEPTLAAYLPRGPFRHPGGRLQVTMVKLYADGALGSRGARLLADYADEPGNRGLLVNPREHLAAAALRAGRAGFQVCTHAIGDGGNRAVLDVYEQVLGELGRLGPAADARWRVEHAQILDPSDLPRFAALGVVASMQPTHCTSDMDWVERRLGPDRCAGAYAWRSLLDDGARLCFGTDFPVERVDPLAGLYAARTRQHPDGTPPGGWRPQERLSGREALRLYTAGGAWAAFREDELGRLAPGMLADMVVLDVDPVACEPAALLRGRTLLTIVGGEVVHDGRGENR